MTNVLETALAAYAPQIAARYSSMVEYGFKNLVEKFGPTMRNERGSVSNSESYKFWSETIRPCTKSEGGQVVAGRQQPATYSIDADKLAARAETYSKLAIESYKGKLEAKMGELEEAEVRSMGGGSFRVSGTKGGKKVYIEQDMIVNQSSKGTLFNQFPARIYVEGKFTSEAKFKKMFA